MVAPPGLEPGSEGPKPPMLDHYTTGLMIVHLSGDYFRIMV